MRKKFKKWHSKIIGGEEGYEGLSFERGILVHSMEKYVTELELVKIKKVKQGKLIEEIMYDTDKNEDRTLNIIVRDYSEMLVTFDNAENIIYFGDDEKCTLKYSVLDEILILIRAKHESFLIYGETGNAIVYLTNAGNGDESKLLMSVYETFYGKKGSDGKKL